MTAADLEKFRIVTFKLSPVDHAALEARAKQHERTVSAELRLAVREWLKDADDEVAA